MLGGIDPRPRSANAPRRHPQDLSGPCRWWDACFGHNTKSTTQTDIILTLTARTFIRVLDLTEGRPEAISASDATRLAPIAELPADANRAARKPAELPKARRQPSTRAFHQSRKPGGGTVTTELAEKRRGHKFSAILGVLRGFQFKASSRHSRPSACRRSKPALP